MSKSKQASDAEIGRMHRQLTKLYGLVEADKRSYEDVVKPLVQAAIEGKVFTPAWYDYGTLLIEGGFTPPELQVANLRTLNRVLKLGIDDDAIIRALFELPRIDWNVWTYRQAALTLCFTLATLEETFTVQLLMMQAVYGGAGKVRISEMRPELVAAKRRLALDADGPKFQPDRVWWEVIDLDAYKGRGTFGIDVKKVPPTHAVGTQLLDVLSQHSPYFLALTKEISDNSSYLRAAMTARNLTVKSPGSKGWDLIHIEVEKGGRIKISTRPKFNSAGSYTSYPTVVKVAA